MTYLFGRHPVLEALQGGRPVQKIFISRSAGRHSLIAQMMHVAKGYRIPVMQVPPTFFETHEFRGKTHQGVAALVDKKAYATLEDLLQIAHDRNEPPFLLLLDHLTDPHNLGAIMRTGEATGVHGMVIPKQRSVGLTDTVAKTSAGALEHLSVARVSNLVQAIDRLKATNAWVYGIDLAGRARYNEIDFTGPVALVVGAEGSGLSRAVRERCDELVNIPMCGKVASLNVSVAAALILYEVYRQRKGPGF